jgi:hypothetical protein
MPEPVTSPRQYFAPLDGANPLTEAAQQIIIQEVLGKQPVEDENQRVALLTAGPPGSGKSSMISALVGRCDGNITQLGDALRQIAHNEQPFTAKELQEADPQARFDNTVYINTAKYREILARQVLEKHQLVTMVEMDKHRDETPDQSIWARQYLMQLAKKDPAQYGELAKLVNDTGAEIARLLLIGCVKNGYACVLDSTGGGFVDEVAAVTDPLLEAAKETVQKPATTLYFLRSDLPKETAIARVQADVDKGRKTHVDPDAIAQDVSRTQRIVDVLQTRTLVADAQPPTMITVDEQLRASVTLGAGRGITQSGRQRLSNHR